MGADMSDLALEELGTPECMRLLGTAAVGRLGFTEAALPAVQPVTYRLADGAVLIPAVAVGRSAGAIRDGIVVLGVDSFGTDEPDEWAVTVVGPARLVETSPGTDSGRSRAWPSGCFLVLEPVLVSGWRRPAGGTTR